ncbi:T9SS type A sorting domain-containing protein, partial [Flavobacterium sp.]|uniref:T9SS type A sorting domain-containing protein n=1 Tax=Flavobacterium sp. TaxID=239 RepID=UPI0037520BA1
LDVPEVIADKNSISLYPNPTKNTISIHLPESGNYQVQDISILNLLGQNVIKNVKNNKNIDVSSLQKGIYIVNLKTNNGDWNSKFVKE